MANKAGRRQQRDDLPEMVVESGCAENPGSNGPRPGDEGAFLLGTIER